MVWSRSPMVRKNVKSSMTMAARRSPSPQAGTPPLGGRGQPVHAMRSWHMALNSAKAVRTRHARCSTVPLTSTFSPDEWGAGVGRHLPSRLSRWRDVGAASESSSFQEDRLSLQPIEDLALIHRCSECLVEVQRANV